MTAYKIDLLATHGSPLGVTPPDIYGRGVGGAELAMMTLMQTFAERGHQVRVFNDPKNPGEYDGVHYLSRAAYKPRERRDVLIPFRQPNVHVAASYAEKGKFWWSTDQQTIGDYAKFAKVVDFCVTISKYHTEYHKRRYGIADEKMGHIDLGVRVEDYDIKVDKVPGRMIFCSVPDRGLMILHSAWPLIRQKAPKATLVITSDYGLWGTGGGTSRWRLHWVGMEGVNYVGNVPRRELIKYQLEAEVLPYTCTYEELFCLSVAESQVAGAMPVTTPIGALQTTNQFGIKVSGNPLMPQFIEEFSDRVASLVTTERQFLEARRESMIAAAKARFDWHVIAGKWEDLFENGRIK